MKYEDYDNEDPSQQDDEEEEEEEEVQLPKKALPNKVSRERNSELISKESSFDNSGSAQTQIKTNTKFRSSRMDDDEEDEEEAERKAI